MENKLKDQTLLAIMEFIHRYDQNVSLNSILNGISYFKLINVIPEFDFQNIQIKLNAEKWSERLQNLQNILHKIEEYFEVVHQKSLQTFSIDLISLTKHENLQELAKYFEIIMMLLMESSLKQQFIQSIMNLQETSQQIFVEIIKNCLDPHKFTQAKYSLHNFHRIITQFEEEKEGMQREIQRLCKANGDLLAKIKDCEETIKQYQLDSSNRQSIVDSSIDQSRNVKYLQEYIDKLQERIVSQNKALQEQRIFNNDKLRELTERNSQLEENQELAKLYKQKYDDLKDQMQKINIWKRERAKMQKTLEEKDFMLHKLQDRIQELSEKNVSLQQCQLQLKIEIQNKELKIQKMSSELKKVMENITINASFSNKIGDVSILDQSIREGAHIKTGQQNTLILEDQTGQLKKENDKMSKKIKFLQKEINKMTKKIEKMRNLQEDKRKLEQALFQMRADQSQELNLIFSIFYDSFEQNINISKKLRNSVLGFHSSKEENTFRRSIKKTSGSNFQLGKQNK